MERVSQFTVLHGQTETLIARVNELIAEGWQPWGGFQHAGHDDGTLGYFGQQAMVRYAEAAAAPVHGVTPLLRQRVAGQR